MLPKVCLILLSFIAVGAKGMTFDQASEEIKKHSLLTSINSEARSLIEEGQKQSSWSDPMLMVAAKNIPKDSLKKDESAMSAIEFGISQKIPLTTKFSNIENSFTQMSKSKEFEKESRYQEFLKYFWEILIDDKKNKEQLSIFNENLVWLENILKSSERLYTNGTISQQALLDIQIRKSEIEAMISNKKYEAEELKAKLSYLINDKSDEVNSETIPWDVLNRVSKELKDFKELSMKSMVESKDYMLRARKLAIIPDLTFSFNYMKRSNIDKMGDFVSASISFPLPTSSTQYAGRTQAIEEKKVASEKLQNYQILKNSELMRLNSELNKVKEELKLLNNKTIKFALNSRNITSRSYGNGGATYFELLQSELKLQELLVRKSELVAKENKLKVSMKYIAGENLNEEKK